MPIKANISSGKNEAISRNSSLINIDPQNATSNNSQSGSGGLKNNDKLKSQSGANEKFSRIEGGEQQVTVNIFFKNKKIYL